MTDFEIAEIVASACSAASAQALEDIHKKYDSSDVSSFVVLKEYVECFVAEAMTETMIQIQKGLR